jgi:hypothetical protein
VPRVGVYRFVVWDQNIGDNVLAPRFATLAARKGVPVRVLPGAPFVLPIKTPCLKGSGGTLRDPTCGDVQTMAWRRVLMTRGKNEGSRLYAAR